MKKSITCLCSLVAGSVIIFSCQKVSPEEEIVSAKKPKTECSIASFRYNTQTPSGSQTQYVFNQQRDASGDLKHISAAVYQGGTISSTAELDVYVSASSIAFVKSGSSDTTLIVSLNAAGRPVQVVAGNAADANFLPTSFEYTNNRLSAMKMQLAGNTITSRFAYNGNSDCISITDDSQNGEAPGHVEYSYSNKKIDGQLYLDEPRPFSWNTFSLLQFAGYFPELQPGHVRTGVQVYWAYNYKVYDVQLSNHQSDGGRLISYDVNYSGGASSRPHFIDWNCGIAN